MSNLETRLSEGLNEVASRLPEEAVVTIGASPSREHRGRTEVVALALVMVVAVGVLSAALLLAPEQPPTTSSTVPEGAMTFDATVYDMTGVSAYQRAIIADGMITRDELEIAMTAMVSCIQAAGFEKVHGLVGDAGNSIVGVAWGHVEPTDAQHAAFDATHETCGGEYFNQVSVLYSHHYVQLYPPEERYPLEVSEAIERCLSGRGIGFEETPVGQDEWYTAISGDDNWIAFRECEAQVIPVVPDVIPESWRTP